MKQREAVILALKELGGKAKCQDICKRAVKHANFTGSKDHDATIRNYLQALRDSGETRQSPGERGYWELISYQEEIASRDKEIERLKKEIETKDNLIKHFRSKEYSIAIISEWMKLYMDACKNKSQTFREKIKEIIVDIASKLKFQYDNETQEIIDIFDDEKQPVINVVKKEYKDNATSADIDIPGITPQDLKDLISGQQKKILGKSDSPNLLT